jgi:ferritin-like metal-binding protein YciE
MTKAAKDSVSHIEDPALRDAALIVNGNFVEHYEIALYGSLLSFARQLGIQQATSLLEETLREEKAADLKLTELANSINSRAARSASA